MAKKKRKRFNSKDRATKFASKVNGQVNDLTGNDSAKSKYTVTYDQTPDTIAHGSGAGGCPPRSPEDGRDFGYPNEYWQ